MFYFISWAWLAHCFNIIFLCVIRFLSVCRLHTNKTSANRENKKIAFKRREERKKKKNKGCNTILIIFRVLFVTDVLIVIVCIARAIPTVIATHGETQIHTNNTNNERTACMLLWCILIYSRERDQSALLSKYTIRKNAGRLQLHEIREHLKYLLYVRFLSLFFIFKIIVIHFPPKLCCSAYTEWNRDKLAHTYTHRNPIPTLFRIQYQNQQFNMFDRIHLNDNCERKNEPTERRKNAPATEYNHFTAFSAGYPMDLAREI